MSVSGLSCFNTKIGYAEKLFSEAALKIGIVFYLGHDSHLTLVISDN